MVQFVKSLWDTEGGALEKGKKKKGEHKKQWGANVYILCLPREVLSAK